MLKFRRLIIPALIVFAGSAGAQVGPIPAPPPPEGPIVLLTSHALDGHGAELEDARIGIAAGKITSLDAPMAGEVCSVGSVVRRTAPLSSAVP